MEKILIAEDEQLIALDMRRRIESLGYTVVGHAPDGEQAVRLAQSALPDLVFMDINMPGKTDGVAASQEIRDKLDIPVVFVTAYADEKTLQRAKATGPFAYLVKPVADRDLRAAAEVSLFRHRIEHDLQQRIQELNALNEMFQRHLAERFNLIEGYKRLTEQIVQIEQQTNILLQVAISQPIPEMEAIARKLQQVKEASQKSAPQQPPPKDKRP
jgi:CheY-like chemotaxis protein